MKKIVTIILLLTLFTGVGCERKLGPKVTDFEMGKGKLIEENKPIEAIGYLEDALKKEQQKVRTRCYLVIAYKRAEDDAATKIMKIDKQEYVEKGRQHLAKLKQLADQAVEELLNIIRDRQAGRIQKDAMQVIVNLGVPAATPLVDNYIEYAKIKYVQEDYSGIHSEIIEMLTEMGRNAIPSLTKALKDSNNPIFVRREIARILGDIGDAKAQKDLEEQLNAADGGLKMEAMVALYKLGSKQYANGITAGLNDRNVNVRRAAARALITMNESPTEKLIEALNDRDSQVRTYSAKALGKHPDERAIAPLLKALKSDEDESVKNAIAETLTELGANYGKRVVDVLVKELGVITDWKVRIRIVSILSKLINNFDKNTAYLLDKHYRNKEDNPMVKSEMDKLLIKLDERGI